MQCALALTWGMPYELYWNGPIEAFFMYQKKLEFEVKQKQLEADYDAWRQGLYIRDALCSVYQLFNPMAGKSDKTLPYPKQPYGFRAERTEEQERLYRETTEKIRRHNEHLARIRAESRAQGGCEN